RQRTCQMKGEEYLLIGKILLCAGEGENLLMQGSNSSDFLGGWLLGFILEEQNFSTEKRTFLIKLENLKAPSAFGNDVEPSVVVFLSDGHDLSGTADLSHAIFGRAHNAEDSFFGQTFPDHLLVTRFEDVERLGNTREQDQLQGEDREQRTHGTSGMKGVAELFRLYATA